MKIAFFDAKPYDKPSFDAFGAQSGVEYKYFETKLTEELNEYLSSKDAEELADLLEVVDALINARGWSREEVEQIRLGKKEKRGGFAERIYLESVSRRATNEAE